MTPLLAKRQNLILNNTQKMSMQQTPRKLLVTSALPYANGPLHIGHLLEHIQADIWVRFQKIRGHHCIFISGEDAHGTPIMLAAQQRNISPEALVREIADAHQHDLTDFFIEFDNFYTTHSPENEALTRFIYQRMKEKGNIYKKRIKQAYDPSAKMFLPDRYVKGACPCCKALDQYGDNCEVCGSTYSPLDLLDPKSIITGTSPVVKESEHYFFRLSDYTEFLHQWITQEDHLADEISNKLLEWFKEGLHDLDISRDAPYFGFKIPGTENKFFYVWIDAPIGYMASFKNLCSRHSDLHFDEYWSCPTTTELYHFIGKDIINFHAIFWPAILKSANFRSPTAIFVHGYVTVNGQKMSKSRGTFISARHYLNHLDPEYLRYYYATKLSRKTEDIDFNLHDFIQKINSDLIGKLVNIASRCASFINKKFAHQLSKNLLNPALMETFIRQGDEISSHYEALNYNRAMKLIMELADKANQMIDAEKPWLLIKNPNSVERAHAVCSLGLNLFRILILYLKPVLPMTAKKVERFLNIPTLTWNQREKGLFDHRINTFTPLLQRIPEEVIVTMQKMNSITAH